VTTEADDIEARVRGVLSDVFGIDADAIGPDTSKDTVKGWDSLQQLTLTLSLEEEFGIRFSDDETVSLVTYPLILLIVTELLV
jgi:acyl carrier protein